MSTETPLSVYDLRNVLTSVIDTIKASSCTEREKNHAAFNILAGLFEGGNEFYHTLVNDNYGRPCLPILDEMREGIPATKEDVAAKLLKGLDDAKDVRKSSVKLRREDQGTHQAVIRLTELAVHSALRTLGFTQRGTMRRDQAER